MERFVTPQSAVIGFITEMRDWESNASRLSKALAVGKTSKEEESSLRYEGIREIFAKYVDTPVDEERLRFHPNGRPPVFMHDPGLDNVVDCRTQDSEAWVTTERQRAGAKLTLVYHLRCRQGCWWISDDRMRVRPDGTSVPYDL